MFANISPQSYHQYPRLDLCLTAATTAAALPESENWEDVANIIEVGVEDSFLDSVKHLKSCIENVLLTYDANNVELV